MYIYIYRDIERERERSRPAKRNTESPQRRLGQNGGAESGKRNETGAMPKRPTRRKRQSAKRTTYNICVYMYKYTFIHTHIEHTHSHLSLSLYIYIIYIYIYVYTYTYVYTCMYIYIYIYICIDRSGQDDHAKIRRLRHFMIYCPCLFVYTSMLICYYCFQVRICAFVMATMTNK